MDEMVRKGPKRLVIDISEEFHKRLKEGALKRNITLRRYVLRMLERGLMQEDK